MSCKFVLRRKAHGFVGRRVCHEHFVQEAVHPIGFLAARTLMLWQRSFLNYASGLLVVHCSEDFALTLHLLEVSDLGNLLWEIVF